MKLNLTTILIIVCAVLIGGVFYLIGSARKGKSYLPEFIAAKDSAIAQSHRREVQLLKESFELKQQAASIQSRDTVYIRQLVSNDKKLKASNDRVEALTDSELEKEINNY